MSAPVHWTRVTPWAIHVSPLDDERMPLVRECATAAEAARLVREHNAALLSDAEREALAVRAAFGL